MADSAPTLLYLDFRPGDDTHRRKLDGIRRYASARGWEVATLTRDIAEKLPRQPLQSRVKRMDPIGIVLECSGLTRTLPPRFFGGIPVAHLDPTEPPSWKNARTVLCDNAAIARAAFRELSADVPAAYAVVPFFLPQRWVVERSDAFRALCRNAGRPCHVFPAFPDEKRRDFIERFHASLKLSEQIRADYSARLAEWAAALPPRCAVFAVNDTSARETLRAFAAAGLAVPHDATLVGADAAESAPAPDISSVRIDFEAAGYAAARMVGEMVSGKGANAANPKLRSSDLMPEGRLHGGGPASVSTFGPVLVERRRSTGGRGRMEPHVLKAVEIIRCEACDGLTAAALAERVPGSRKLLELRFREATGHSILDEIFAVRMDRVFVLLARPDIPIADIASLCGFGSDIALRHHFRNRTGTSLRKWRADHLRRM